MILQLLPPQSLKQRRAIANQPLIDGSDTQGTTRQRNVQHLIAKFILARQENGAYWSI
jgi:hypothetical protein